VGERAVERGTVAQPGVDDRALEGAAQRPVADDPQAKRRLEAGDRLQQGSQALLLDQAADRQQLQWLAARRQRRREASEVDAVGDQLDTSAGRTQVVRDVGVAGHDTRRRAGAPGELATRDLADVARVGAERERDAEHRRRAFGDSGRRVCEIGVDRAYASAAHALDHTRHLRAWSRIGQHLDAAGQRLGAGLRGVPVAGLGGEDCP